MTYVPRTAPKTHQAEFLQRSLEAPVFAFLMEPGTGKSWLVVQTLGHWWTEHGLRGALIVAPNGVHENWLDQFTLHLGESVPVRMLAYNSRRRLAQRIELAQWEEELPQLREHGLKMGPLWIATMNIEALSSASGQDFAKEFLSRVQQRRAKVAFIVDESHKIKKPSAHRTRAALRLAERTDLRRLLSGTPMPKGLEDLYAPYRMLDWRIFGSRTAAGFRAMFCIEQKFAKFSKIVGYRNVDQLKRLMAPVTAQIRLDECMDLPPVQGGLLGPSGPERIRIPMLDEQRRMYEDLRKNFMTLLRSGRVMTAPEVTTRLIRLQQLTSGIVQPDGEDTPYQMIPTAKTAATVDLIETNNAKTIVWCRFKAEVPALVADLAKAGISAVGHSGFDKAESRVLIRKQWQESDTQVLVSTLSTGATGFTFNEATVAIFFSNWWGYDDRLQAERRNLRIGQGKPVIYYDVLCKNTVDEYILSTLLRKQSISQLIEQNPRDVLTDLTLTEAA